MKVIKTGTYQHYKGAKYEVIGTALHTETKEFLVVYKALYPIPELPEGILFTRPMDMFLEKVEQDGEMVERFKKCN